MERKQPRRSLAGIPKGSLVMARQPHVHKHKLAIVLAGRIWWDGRSFETASEACRAMRGDDHKQVSGWRDLEVLTDEGFLALEDAYDRHLFGPAPEWTREQLRAFLGEVKPESLGLTPKEAPDS